MKKFNFVKYILFLFCFFSILSIQAQETIKVGIYENFPMVYKDKSGNANGLFIDLINEISTKENWKIEYVFDTWDQSLENLKESKLDLIPNITFLAEREEFIDYNKEAIFNIWGVVITSKTSPIQNILDLKNKKIAILKNGVHGINFLRLSKKFDLNCEFIELRSYNEVMEYIKTNKCDAGISNNISAKSNIERFNLVETPILFNPDKLLFAVPKGKNKELIDTIDKYLTQWKNDINSPYQMALEKWYGKQIVDTYIIPIWLKRVLITLGIITVFALTLLFLARKLVHKRTQELKQSNQLLKNEMNDRIEIESDLRESNQYNRALFEETTLGLALSSTEGNLNDINPAFAKIIGRSVEETKKLTFWDITPQKYNEQEQIQIESLKINEEYGPYEKEYIHKDGHLVPVKLQGKVIKQKGVKYIWSSVENITEQKAAQVALRESNLYNRALFEETTVGLALSSTEGHLTDVNPAFAKIIGRSIEETKKLTYWELTPQKYNEQELIQINSLKTNGTYGPYEKEYIHKDGHLVPVRLQGKIITQKGINYIWSTVEDITISKQAENKIKQLNEELENKVISRTSELEKKSNDLNDNQLALLNLIEDLNEKSFLLENTNKELESFSYSVSHDLRAPLRGIDGFSQALLEDYSDLLDEQGKNYISRVRKGTQKMALLIDEMLNLSRLGKMLLKPISVNLSKIATSICKNLHESDSQRSAEFIIATDISCIADPTLIRAVLQNLLENSWKFTSKNTKTKIEFGILENEGKITYFVKDNGAGFNMEYEDKLFIPFQRLHSESEFPGTGIGLTIVQRIIHRHKGTLWAESKVNTGATFYFTLNA